MAKSWPGEPEPFSVAWDWDWVHGWSRRPATSMTDKELVESILTRMVDIQQRLDANEKKLLEILHGKQVDGQDPPEGKR